MRAYRILVNESGNYELVPVGWSFWAFALGGWWALAHNVLLRYLKLFLLPIVIFAFGAELGPDDGSAGMVFVTFGGVWAIVATVHFSLVAFDWRVAVLEQRGYKRVGTHQGRTALEALRAWSMTEAAGDYIDAEDSTHS